MIFSKIALQTALLLILLYVYADPMWLIPVGTLLQCEYMPSHQEALAKGMLVQYTSEIAGRVIFGQYPRQSRITAHHGIAQSPMSGSLSAMRIHKVRYNSSMHVILMPSDGAHTPGEQLRELQRLLIRMMKVHERCDIYT